MPKPNNETVNEKQAREREREREEVRNGCDSASVRHSTGTPRYGWSAAAETYNAIEYACLYVTLGLRTAAAVVVLRRMTILLTFRLGNEAYGDAPLLRRDVSINR